jgi:lysophospholipase L1-like esterase/predicted negative regulator of RcsB-dependent stress response
MTSAADSTPRAAEASSAPAPARPRAWSWRKRWGFRALAVALALLLLGGCELVLRLSGVGDPRRLVVAVQPTPTAGGNSQLNPQIDRVYFGRLDLSGPEPRRFSLPKPPRTQRIVFLGESTVIGFPYGPEIAFPRQVELLLEAQQPGIDVEVLNAGITAINSFQILDLARECLACDPDLVVLHFGHNEYYGPAGPGSTALTIPRWLVPWTFAARRTRILQCLAALGPASPPETKHPLAALPRNTDIRWQDEVYRQGVENFRSHLSKIVETLRAGGVTVVLSTMGCNLKDQGPIRTVWPTTLTPVEQQQVQTLLVEAEERSTRGADAAALERLEQAERLATEVAVVQFRKGEVLLKLGRAEEALEAFQRARDYDGCRFRAPGEFAQIVRELAAHQRLPLVDLEKVVADDGGATRVPGRDLFLEHVHYNLSGHRLAARAFARGLLTQGLHAPWRDDRDLSDPDLDAALGVLDEDRLVGETFAWEVLQTAPLSESLDAPRQWEWLKVRLAETYRQLPPERQEAFSELSLQAMQGDLTAALTQVHLSRGNLDLAAHLAEVGVRRRPWSPEAWLHWGEVEAFRGAKEQARRAFAEALRLRPGWPAAETFLHSETTSKTHP